MQLNCKVIKKWQSPHFYINPPFLELFPVSSKIFGTFPKWLNFGRSYPPPPLISGGAGGPTMQVPGWRFLFEMVDAIPVTNITSSAVIDHLRCTFSIHGILYFLVSDNGPSLASQEFKTICKLNGIMHLMIAPYHPSSNGAAECLVQTFKTTLKKIIEGKEVKELNVFKGLFCNVFCWLIVPLHTVKHICHQLNYCLRWNWTLAWTL